MSIKNYKNKFDISQKDTLLLSLLKLSKSISADKFHLEDIAIENKKSFPNLFTWSKYKENIDLRQVMRSLNKLKNEGFISGSNTSAWSLSKKGQIYAEDLASNYPVSQKIFRQGSDFFKREKHRIFISDAYIKYKKGNPNDISERDINYLFRIDSYNSSKDSITRNKERLYKASIGDTDLTEFLDLANNLLKKISEQKK